MGPLELVASIAPMVPVELGAPVGPATVAALAPSAPSSSLEHATPANAAADRTTANVPNGQSAAEISERGVRGSELMNSTYHSLKLAVAQPPSVTPLKHNTRSGRHCRAHRHRRVLPRP